MRVELSKHTGYRGGFTGTFERNGTKPAYRGPVLVTVLLTDVKFESGETACDHLWFIEGVQWRALAAQLGDRIAFDARITSYEKGYKGRREDFDLPPVETDYKLSFPNHFRVLGRPEAGAHQFLFHLKNCP